MSRLNASPILNASPTLKTAMQSLLIFCSVTCSAISQAAPDQVVLLHGIAKSRTSMDSLASSLTTAGYQVINLDYPSTDTTIEAQASLLLPEIKASIIPDRTVHMVGHSMGGLIALVLAEQLQDYRLGRMVQLGTPNGGSEVADWLEHNALFKRFYGPAGGQLTTQARGQHAVDDLSIELGIIAGKLSVDPLSSLIIPGKDDGKVAVMRTTHPGMRDHITLNVAHPFLPRSKRAQRQVRHFLKYGTFERQ